MSEQQHNQDLRRMYRREFESRIHHNNNSNNIFIKPSIIVNRWPTPQIARKKLIEAGQDKYKNTPIERQTCTTAVSLTN